MSLKSISEISRDGVMRGVVVSVNDLQLEGRVALHVPKMVTKYDPKNVQVQSRKNSINTDIIANDDFKDLLSDSVETVNYIWFRPLFRSSFMVPYVGMTVQCFFEDGDPNKPYYYPHNTTLNGEVIPMTKLKATADKYDAATKPLVHVMNEFQDGTIVYHNENKANKRFAVTFQNNHSFSINENEKENSIQLITESGHELVLDQKNKHITATSAGLHMIKMDDVTSTITVKTTEGHTVIMDDKASSIVVKTIKGHTISMDDKGKNILIQTTGGHKINMDDGGATITAEASSGGKVVIGNGKVMIN